jgi:flagellar biosynthesis protein FliQ
MLQGNTSMTPADLLDMARDGIFTFLKVAGPLMLVALAIGFIISLIQALTQIQEQTLVYVPKILVICAAMLFLFPFMGDAMGSYMTRVAARIVAGG